MKKLTRRDLLGSVGAAAGASLLAGCAAEVSAAKGAVPADSTDWAYVCLDAALVAEKAYRMYPDGACMYASFGSIVSTLGGLLGGLWRSFPIEMMRYGEGGAGGWGSLCGALNGAAAAIGLVHRGKDGERRAQLIGELFSWYENADLPKWCPEKTADSLEIRASIAKSVLCHVSVNRWCEVSKCNAFSKEKRERCRRLTADVVIKSVELLNRAVEPSGTFAGLAPQTKSCTACHGKTDRADAMVKMRCDACHTSFKKCPQGRK